MSDMSDEHPTDTTAQAGGRKQGSSASTAPVAVLGAGTMGAAMAHRLLECGRRVQVWNRSPGPLAGLASEGAETFLDAAAAVDGVPVVLTLLPTVDVVAAVMLEAGLLEALAPNAVWAQMGTIGVAGTDRLDAEVRARRPDVLFVDAPVSGSRAPGASGALEILASGPEAARPTVDPVFAQLGRRTVWLGAAGAGSRMKLVLNTWLAFEVEAAAEAAALAAGLGISDDALTDTITGSPLVSAFAGRKLAKMQSGDDEADFALELALKDLDLAAQAAGTGRAPVGAAIAERWRRLVAHGFGHLDVSAARRELDCGTLEESR